MKSRIVFYDIDDEAVQKAENMNIPAPKPDLFETVLYFDIDAVKVFYANREGDIALHTTVGTFVIPYDKGVWQQLKAKFPDD